MGNLPLGVFGSMEILPVERKLRDGDYLVMVSDGVVASGCEWLVDLVMAWEEDENPNLLAQQITEEARKRRADGHEDDVTALVLVLQ